MNPIPPPTILDAGSLREPPGPAAPKDAAALEQAAKDFESVLLEKVLETMRATIPDSGLLGDEASKQYEGMFWSFLARDIANQGGVGLWRDVYREWSAQQAPQAQPAQEHDV